MTFTLIEECLFCHKKRVEQRYHEGKGYLPTELWETKVMVFFTRKDHHPDDKVFPSEAPPIEHRFGWVVTVCRTCRATHTVEDLVKAAKEVY